MINKFSEDLQSYIPIRFPESSEYVGVSVVVTKNDGTILSDVYVIGEGLASDNTATPTFGLGDESGVKSMDVQVPDGSHMVIDNPVANRLHRITK